ncbi:MAG: hypothetical protein HY821_26025 [Acidobacteria bacterium]|nr:hypothetical protein [Acidobacteriota bacterium]
MTYILNGFSQEGEYRVFSFEGIDSERVRTTFLVRIHLALSRQYGIRIQDLPLLCKGVLERSGEEPASPTTTFTEREMDEYAKVAAARVAATQRTGPRKPAGANLGAAWRTPPQGE